jgi:hypothetical protein
VDGTLDRARAEVEAVIKLTQQRPVRRVDS